jgi:hypothetical protein
MTEAIEYRARCLFAALLCLAAGFAWQALTVQYNYGGNWTALFCTGTKYPVPPSLSSEDIYIFANITGYDGQMYHYVAHDPFLRSGLSQFVDNARVRYRRILLPATAYLLAGLRQSRVDQAYIIANLLFAFLGAWWLARYAVLLGRTPFLAVLLAVVPATLISLDRLTIDLSFTALCIGFALYAQLGSSVKLAAVLGLASLSRETGLVLVLAYAGAQFAMRRFTRGALYLGTAVPALLWWAYVQTRTPDSVGPTLSQLIPFRGILNALIRPTQYPFSPLVNGVITTFDYGALIGILLACGLAIARLWRKPAGYLEIAMALWGLIAITLPYEFWADCCSSGRVFSPLLLFLVMGKIESASTQALYAVPLLLVSPRTWLQLLSSLWGVIKGVFGL